TLTGKHGAAIPAIRTQPAAALGSHAVIQAGHLLRHRLRLTSHPVVPDKYRIFAVVARDHVIRCRFVGNALNDLRRCNGQLPEAELALLPPARADMGAYMAVLVL